MKSKDQQLLEEAYVKIICEKRENVSPELAQDPEFKKYRPFFNKNPKRINYQEVSTKLSQESGLDPTLIYLDSLWALSEWIIVSDDEYGVWPGDFLKPKETWNAIQQIASLKSEAEINNLESDIVNWFRIVKKTIPFQQFKQLYKKLVSTDKGAFNKYKRSANQFWRTYYAWQSDLENYDPSYEY